MEIEASSYLSSAAVEPGLCWSWSNYRLFSHGVVSYMFNEESDNVVLEYRFTHYVKAGLSLHWAHIQSRTQNDPDLKLKKMFKYVVSARFLVSFKILWSSKRCLDDI